MLQRCITLAWGAVLALSVGCAPAAKPAEAPEKKAEPEAKAEPESEPEAAPEPEVEKPTKPPSDVLVQNDTMFSLNFSSSEPGRKAEESCDKKHANNPKARNQCMRAQRQRIKEDVLQFTKDDQGQLHWTISQQKGNRLIRLKKVQFELGKETENSIEIKLKGGSQRSLVIKIPNDYTIEVPNQAHGTLVYDAKVELAADE